MPSPYEIATSITRARQSIDVYVTEWWVTDKGKSASRIAWPNAVFQKPQPTAANPEWLQVAILWGSTTQATLAAQNALNRRVGLLILTIFGARATGAAILDELASSAFAKFNRQIVNGIEYYQCEGPADIADPAWASAQLAIRFFFWETVTPSVTT